MSWDTDLYTEQKDAASKLSMLTSSSLPAQSFSF